MENELMKVNGGLKKYCSFAPSTPEEKIAFFNLINGETERLINVVNTPLKLCNVYAEECIFSEKNGEPAKQGIRIILIDDAGKAFSCASVGVFTSLTNIFSIFGEPATWAEPLTVIPKLKQIGSGQQVMTLQLQ